MYDLYFRYVSLFKVVVIKVEDRGFLQEIGLLICALKRIVDIEGEYAMP
jgi:hypothetical protein